MNKKGFTLIELLAVILILGIIALIAIPAVNDIINESKVGAEKATINNIISSYESYYQLAQLHEEAPIMDMKASGQTIEQIANTIGVKGDIHSLSNYEKFELDANGNAVITYVVGTIRCSNDGLANAKCWNASEATPNN